MGRIKLRRVLTLGLVLILFLSLVASAIGVSTLVRGYLWNRNQDETRLVARGVERYLEQRAERAERTPDVVSADRTRPGRNRLWRRFNRGPGQLLLVQNGKIVRGEEEEERDWSALIPRLKPGMQEVEFDGESWQVLVQDVKSPLADQFVIVRPWSPSIRLIRFLVLYQVLASGVVMLLALAAVSAFTSRLARPLEELREKTKSVGKDSIEDLKHSSVVEIADLQVSFVEMSRRVDEAMASQRRFVADASHELKSPLTAISGMLELLRDRPDMDEADRAHALTVAKTEADRMESLIADLLLLSRAQAKRSGTKTEVRLADVVQEEIATLKMLFPHQEFVISGDTSAVHSMNKASFSRVARNLMENAARYAGGEPVELIFAQKPRGVSFKVRDRGPGISQDKLEQLFERFYRTDTGRARSEGGHGLGLAIVKALVEEAGGTITCRSTRGGGSEFRVFFSKS